MFETRANPMARHIYAIGDIHGCADKLRRLIDQLAIDPKQDQLVFVGDYIDRGPDSFEVVDYLLGLKSIFPNVVFLKGNHEQMLEDYLAGPDKLTFLINGGQATLDSYLRHRPSPQGPVFPLRHQVFFRGLRLFYETENYLFVHAGLKPKVPLAQQHPGDLLWIRSQFIYSDVDFGKQVVFGHTPFPEPLVQANKIGIDTGAVYGHQLTCVKLPDLVFFQSE
ncbi:MAG: metallophosphoesterase family protein [Desulfobacterales bacterium]|jgi:serine/threonine protein phosphatase 1|nr:metallophosphoesterase family protein [Desulfobacterales bacterium]